MTDADDLVRAVAADMGGDVLAALDAPPADTRAFGIPEAAAIASVLVQCAQLTYEIWQARQDHALLVAALAKDERLMKGCPRLDPEKRYGVMARVLEKFLPDTFGRPSGYRSRSVAEKQRWIAEYVASRRNDSSGHDAATRGLYDQATILLPFADQFWWIVYKPVGWVPEAADGPDVIRVDVPKGFVTDLASIPSYLWAILQKTGRYGNAAIYHDWLYWQQSCPRETADAVFNRTMHDMGVDAVSRNLIWAGVRVFGGRYWDENATAKGQGEKRVLGQFPDKPTVTWEEWRERPGVFA